MIQTSSPPQKPEPHFRKGLSPLPCPAGSTKYGLGEDPPKVPCSLGGGGCNGIIEKRRGSHSFSQTHPFLDFHRQRHTPKAPAITLGPPTAGPLTCGHPKSSLPRRGLHLRTQPGLGGRGVYPPRTKGPNSSRLAILGVDSPPSSPFFAAEASLPPLPRGLGSCARTPGLGWGVGEGRGGGGGSSKRDTKRRPSASAPWRRWGGGRAHPILPSPPAGLGTSAATHLLPLTWARLT